MAFTSKAAHFTDVMDVIFVTHLVERLTRLVEKHKDVRSEFAGKYNLGILLQSGFQSISTVESEQMCPKKKKKKNLTQIHSHPLN